MILQRLLHTATPVGRPDTAPPLSAVSAARHSNSCFQQSDTVHPLTCLCHVHTEQRVLCLWQRQHLGHTLRREVHSKDVLCKRIAQPLLCSLVLLPHSICCIKHSNCGIWHAGFRQGCEEQLYAGCCLWALCGDGKQLFILPESQQGSW